MFYELKWRWSNKHLHFQFNTAARLIYRLNPLKSNSHKYGRGLFSYTVIFMGLTMDGLIQEEYHPKFFLPWRILFINLFKLSFMNKPIETSTLKTWKDNLQPTADTPVLTTEALITLGDLEDFLQEIKAKNADSVRINLVRFDWKTNEPQEIKENGANFPKGCKWQVTGTKTQVAIAMNGTQNFKQNADYTTQADDIIENDKLLMLIPGGKEEGPTGHNPKPTGG